jgi:hypothetical protein
MPDGRTEAAAKAEYEQDGAIGGPWDDISERLREQYINGQARTLAAADGWDRDHGIVRTDRRTPDDAVIGYRVRVDGREYMLHPSDVDLVRPGVPQGEAQ